MKLLLLILFFTYSSAKFVILQSDLKQYITSVNPPQPTVLSNYDYHRNIPQAPNAQWIWDANWNNSQCAHLINITQIFTVTCNQPITLYATADTNFTIYINGFQVLKGDNQNKIYSVVIPSQQLLGCKQTNTMIIQAQKNGTCSPTNPAGVIYALTQNIQHCYNCHSGLHYNTTTCSCDCNNDCVCNSPHIWSGTKNLPYCSCICPNRTLCSALQYYDESSCSCQCIPKFCNQNYIQDPTTCQCKLLPCSVTVVCTRYYHVNNSTCQCQLICPNVTPDNCALALADFTRCICNPIP